MLPVREQFQNRFLSLFGDAGWSAAATERLLERVDYRQLAAGTVLLRDGDSCHQVPFVLSGSIRVFRTAESGREITLYRIQGGQSCILSSGCAEGVIVFPATAVAEVATTAAFLPAVVIGQLFEQSTAFRTYVLAQYAERLADVIELVEEVAFRHVDERLHEFLLTAGADDSVIKLTHQELADQIGTSREVVSRIVKDWEARQLLDLGRGVIRLRPGFGELPR